MVWIHGGAFTLGSSNSYDGGGLCESGNILVVTLNYRLGVFGFADIGNVTNTVMPGNLGLRDIVQALKWIKDNIAAFGGDPDQVTVAGESAGSIAISLLLLADTASGLFRGVILQSGGINLIHDKAMAAQTSRAYRKVLGDPTLAELRAMPAGKLLQAQISVARLLGGAIPCSPWFDGDLLPASLKAAHSKPTHPVRMLAGYNREETALFEKLTRLLPVPVHRRFCEDQLRRALGETHASDIIASYPETRMGSRLLATDLYFSMGMINMLERHSERAPAWHYRFDYRHWWLGAAHGLELLFLWPFNGPLAALGRGGFLTGQKRALAETLQRHWISFVRHGQPGQDWGEYKTGDRQTMLLDMHSRLERDPASETRKIWKGQDFIPRTFGGVSDEASL
jgi:para-nitrobenzyl esterase